MTSRKKEPLLVQVRYSKSNMARVVHGDGVLGGPTPQGYIYMAFFSEHATAPESTQYRLNLETHHAEEIQQPARTIARSGVTREIEVEVMVNLTVAKSFREWLDRHIKQLEQTLAEAQQIGNKS